MSNVYIAKALYVEKHFCKRVYAIETVKLLAFSLEEASDMADKCFGIKPNCHRIYFYVFKESE